MPNISSSSLLFQSLLPPAGPFNVSVLQLEGEGRGADQVLPRFLLRVRQDALRHTSEEVPQVQRRFRSQRFPPHLHRLMPPKHTHTHPEGEEQRGPPRLNMHPSPWQQHGGSGLLRSGGTELNVEFKKKTKLLSSDIPLIMQAHINTSSQHTCQELQWENKTPLSSVTYVQLCVLCIITVCLSLLFDYFFFYILIWKLPPLYLVCTTLNCPVYVFSFLLFIIKPLSKKDFRHRHKDFRLFSTIFLCAS